MSVFTGGFWDSKQEQFDVAFKISDPQLEHPALAIYAPGTEQEISNMLKVLQLKGLLRFEDGHFVVTEAGQRYRSQIHHMLPNQEEKQP